MTLDTWSRNNRSLFLTYVLTWYSMMSGFMPPGEEATLRVWLRALNSTRHILNGRSL